MSTKFQFSSFLCLGDTGGHFNPLFGIQGNEKKHVGNLRVNWNCIIFKYRQVSV